MYFIYFFEIPCISIIIIKYFILIILWIFAFKYSICKDDFGKPYLILLSNKRDDDDNNNNNSMLIQLFRLK